MEVVQKHISLTVENFKDFYLVHRLFTHALLLLHHRHALTALTRVMPKDGRKHQSRFVGYYAEHGKSVDAFIKEMRGRPPPMILVSSRLLVLSLQLQIIIIDNNKKALNYRPLEFKT